MPKNLLVADDSLTIRKVIGMIFATEDFQITTVDNGIEAIQKTRELRPDLSIRAPGLANRPSLTMPPAARSRRRPARPPLGQGIGPPHGLAGRSRA